MTLRGIKGAADHVRDHAFSNPARIQATGATGLQPSWACVLMRAIKAPSSDYTSVSHGGVSSLAWFLLNGSALRNAPGLNRSRCCASSLLCPSQEDAGDILVGGAFLQDRIRELGLEGRPR